MRPSIVIQTIPCPICGTANSYLLSRCNECGAFTQDRVPAVNLFSMILKVIDSPGAAFRLIARSEQKNYVYTLFAFGGYALTAVIFMIGRIGNIELNFVFTLFMFALIGPWVGIAFFSLVTLVTWLVNRHLWHASIPYRDTASFLAYALVPVVFSVFFVLPVELGLFGRYLFSDNPSALFIKPLEFSILTGLDIIATCWSIFLFIHSFRSVYSFQSTRIIPTALVASLFLAGLLFASGVSVAKILFG